MKRLFPAQKTDKLLKKMSRTAFDAVTLPAMIVFGLGPYLLIGAAALIVIFAVVKILKISREKRGQ